MIVIDASVAVKWFATEDHHEAALALLSSSEMLLAPDIVLSETMHALRRKLRIGDITEEQYLRAGSDLPSFFDEIVPSAPLIGEAARLSIRLDHGFYDCVYLALAMTAGTRMATADEAFAGKAKSGGLGETVIGIQNQPATNSGLSERVSEELVGDVDRLARKVDQTLRSLEPPREEGKLQFISTSVYGPAFESPAYLRLKKLIQQLDPRERTYLIALGWYGRPYEHGAFSSHLENAQQMFGGNPEADLPYIISVMRTVRDGFEKLLSSPRVKKLDE